MQQAVAGFSLRDALVEGGALATELCMVGATLTAMNGLRATKVR